MRFIIWQANWEDKVHREHKVCVWAAGERSGISERI